MILITLFVGIIVLFVKTEYYGSKCAELEYLEPTTVEKALECLNSFPNNHERQLKILEYAIKLSDYYVFKDYFTDTGEPWNMKIDIVEELEKMKSTDFISDYAFHLKLQKTISSVRDPHFRYSLPSCYSVSFRQPFEVRQLSDGSFETESSYVSDYFQKVYPKRKDLYEEGNFNGLKIERINDMDPKNAIQEFAQETCDESKDIHICYNYVLSDGKWSTRSEPSEPITYSIRKENGKIYDVVAPWIAFMHNDFRSPVSMDVLCGYKDYPEEWNKNFSSPQDKHQYSEGSFRSIEEKEEDEKVLDHSLFNILFSIFTDYSVSDSVGIIEQLIGTFDLLRITTMEIDINRKGRLLKEKLRRNIREFGEPFEEGEESLFLWGKIDNFKEVELPHAGYSTIFQLFHHESQNDLGLLKVESFSPNLGDLRNTPRKGFSKEEITQAVKDAYRIMNEIIKEGKSHSEKEQQEELLRRLSEENEFFRNLIGRLRSFYDPFHSFIRQLEGSFEKMSELGIEKLVIDVRQNPGGIECFAYALLGFLSPYSPLSPGFVSDMLVTELGKYQHCGNNLIERSFFRNVHRRRLPSDWYSSGRIITRGEGKTSKYTSLFIPSCDVFNTMLFLFFGSYMDSENDEFNYRDRRKLKRNWKPWRKSPKMFEPENLIVLTDGSCASACGVFLRILQELHLGKVVSLGGVMNQSNELMDTAICTGAAVMDGERLVDITMDPLGFCKVPESKKHLIFEKPKMNSMFTVSWREQYPYNPLVSAFEFDKVDTSIPMEFVSKPADFHINNWNFDDSVISEVIPFFDVCASWEVKRDMSCKRPSDGFKGPKNHAVFGHPCKGGKFDFSSCVFRGCDRGYYLSETGSKCLQMPEDDILGTRSFYYFFFCFFSLCICCSCIGCILYGILFVTKKRVVLDEENNYDGLGDSKSEITSSVTSTSQTSTSSDSQFDNENTMSCNKFSSSGTDTILENDAEVESVFSSSDSSSMEDSKSEDMGDSEENFTSTELKTKEKN